MAENKETTKSKLRSVIVRPHVTEKAAMLSAKEAPIYTFEILASGNKDLVAKEVKREFKVTPIKIRITNLPAKRVFVRGKWGAHSAKKKALVYLKKGDKIEFA